jgi:hypothetical protein
LFADKRFDAQLIAGGSHLSEKRGLTVKEIEQDGWSIAACIPLFSMKRLLKRINAVYREYIWACGHITAPDDPLLRFKHSTRGELVDFDVALVVSDNKLIEEHPEM